MTTSHQGDRAVATDRDRLFYMCTEQAYKKAQQTLHSLLYGDMSLVGCPREKGITPMSVTRWTFSKVRVTQRPGAALPLAYAVSGSNGSDCCCVGWVIGSLHRCLLYVAAVEHVVHINDNAEFQGGLWDVTYFVFSCLGFLHCGAADPLRKYKIYTKQYVRRGKINLSISSRENV